MIKKRYSSERRGCCMKIYAHPPFDQFIALLAFPPLCADSRRVILHNHVLPSYPYTTGASSTHHPPPPPSSSVSSSPSSPTTRPCTSPRRAAGWSGYRHPVLAVGYRAGMSNVQYGLFTDQSRPCRELRPAYNLPGPTLKHSRKFSFHPQSYGFT